MSTMRAPATWLMLAAAMLAGCASAPPAAPPPPPPLTFQVSVSQSELAVLPTAPRGSIGAAVVEPPIEIRPRQTLNRSLIDPLEDSARASLWQRVRDGFAMPELAGDLVRKWEQYYASRPEYVQRMVERGARYLFHIVEEVERREMPSEIALLPFVESAFDPKAMSVARASGMWQFMPGTGRDFELRQNVFRDDRRDVLASTRAALDYLQSLHRRFGDWQLALAAYNWGPGNVQRAVAQNQRAGGSGDYAGLRMPEETRNYVPKLQAIRNIIARPDAFALELPPLENHPFFVTVPIDRDIDVAIAARLAGMSVEQFQQLNPQMNKPVILAAGTPQVLLPYDHANRFVRELQAYRGALASWTAWVAPATVKPAEVARRLGIAESALREVNHIPMRMMVRAGSTLLVPRSATVTSDVAEHVADNATMALAPEPSAMRRVSVKVGRRGETVAAVAKRFGVSTAQVAAANGVSPAASFRPGQTVRVLLPQQTLRAASARPSGKAQARKDARPSARVRVAQR